jgi:hypothetical protein
MGNEVEQDQTFYRETMCLYTNLIFMLPSPELKWGLDANYSMCIVQAESNIRDLSFTE